MKVATWAKVAMLVVLGVCSSLITSSILAQSRKSQPSRLNAKGGGRIEVFKRSRGDSAQAKAPSLVERAVPEGHLVASAQFDVMDVEAVDGGIAVSAKIVLQDRRPTWSYVWTLSVRDSSDKEVVGANYNHQVFSMPSGEAKSVTFNETVPVKPGEYAVELRLWHARPDADLTSLRAVRDLSRAHPELTLAKRKRIVIGE